MRDTPISEMVIAAQYAATATSPSYSVTVCAEHRAGPIVRGNVKRTLAQLKRAVGHEQVRAEAARRRAART